MIRSRRRPSGQTLAAVIVFSPVIFGMLALCVDVGLRRTVGSELQATADAAAIAGAQILAESADSGRTVNAASGARSIALSNKSTLCATPPATKIDVGAWDSDARTFGTASADESDAVRVTMTRSPAQGSGVPTLVGRALNLMDTSSTRTAVARVETAPDYALLGLDHFASRGVLTVDGSPWTGKGSIASNGNVDLNILGLIGVTLMDGHIATRGTVHMPLIGILTKISDGIRRPDKPFYLPPVSIENVKLKNDNALLGSAISSVGNLNVALLADVPAGTYYVENLNVLAGALIRFHGPVTIYVANDVNVLGTVLVLNGDPANLKIRVAGPGSIFVAANVALSADVYAPKSAVTIAAGVIYRGRLMAKSIDILGTSLFFLRPELPQPELGRSRVTLVK